MLTLNRGISTLTFGVYLCTSIGMHYVGRAIPSEACAAAWALTLIFSLAEYAFQNWPVWRSDENMEPIPICIAGVMMVFGFKGFELLL